MGWSNLVESHPDSLGISIFLHCKTSSETVALQMNLTQVRLANLIEVEVRHVPVVAAEKEDSKNWQCWIHF